MKLIGYQGSKDLDAEPGNKDRCGFAKGQRYILFWLGYHGSVLRLQESEISPSQWVRPDEINDLLETTRPVKRPMIERVLGIGGAE